MKTSQRREQKWQTLYYIIEEMNGKINDSKIIEMNWIAKKKKKNWMVMCNQRRSSRRCFRSRLLLRSRPCPRCFSRWSPRLSRSRSLYRCRCCCSRSRSRWSRDRSRERDRGRGGKLRSLSRSWSWRDRAGATGSSRRHSRASRFTTGSCLSICRAGNFPTIFESIDIWKQRIDVQ